MQPLIYTGASIISDLTLDDLDNDGDIDIVFASLDNDLVAWMENSDGLGTFSEPVTISTLANGPRTVTIYDFDNDADSDIVSGSSNDDKIAWYENSNGLATFEIEQIITSSISFPLISQLADLDGDGDLDALCFSLLDDKLSWYENEDGEGNFGPQRIINTDMRSNRAMQVADLDGDGDLDIVTGDEFSSSADKLFWFENIDGLGNFVSHILVQNTPGIMAICLEDLDNDGDVDILYSRRSNFDVLWLENVDGMGTFGSVQTIETSYGTPIDIFCADFNGDDQMDVLVAGSNGHTTWYPNNGSNVFPNQILISSPTTYAPKTALADIDGDGDMDIICADEMNSSVQHNLGWRENLDGLGNFGPKQGISTNLYFIESIEPVDIDNDGDIDIVIGSDGGIQIFQNTDGEGFYSYFGAAVDNDCDRNTVDCGDINGDGNTDILSGLHVGANLFIQDSLLWYENSGLLGNKIKGTARIDLDGDGCATSYLPMNGLLIVADNGANSYSTFTLQNGHYEIFLDTGAFVTSAAIALPDYYNSDPESYSLEFLELGNIEIVDFCLTPNTLVNDVNIVILPIDDAAPGFNAEYQLAFQNNGSTTLSGDITLTYDGTKMSFISSSVIPSNQSASLLTFEYTDLYPFEVRTINITFNILPPPTTNIDDNLNFLATINPISGDLTTSDNTMEYNQMVIGAYDPNDITCLEGEEIDIENTGEYLHYIIRFQNTGTASAVRVEIVNILDEKLEWSTLQPIGSSHDNVVEIINGNDVTFVFDAIYLPDNTSDEPNSHGYVSYKIRPRSNVVIGDIIYNTASIYFDFNPAIITNTAATEIVEGLVDVRNIGSLSFLVYPVPAEETLRVQSTTLVRAITIYNMLGQKLLSAVNSNEVDVTMLKSGMYLIQVADVSGLVGVKKFVKN